MEQKYEYVPAFVKVNENLSSVSSALDLNTLGSSELTTVCGISSRLIHVTVVPAATAKVAGEKLKLSILISTVCSWPCSLLEQKLLEPAASKATAVNSEDVNTAMRKNVRIIFVSFFCLNFLICLSATRRKGMHSRFQCERAWVSVRPLCRQTVHCEVRSALISKSLYSCSTNM